MARLVIVSPAPSPRKKIKTNLRRWVRTSMGWRKKTTTKKNKTRTIRHNQKDQKFHEYQIEAKRTKNGRKKREKENKRTNTHTHTHTQKWNKRRTASFTCRPWPNDDRVGAIYGRCCCCYCCLPGFTGFLPSFTWFDLVLLGFYRVWLRFTGFYWVLLGRDMASSSPEGESGPTTCDEWRWAQKEKNGTKRKQKRK